MISRYSHEICMIYINAEYVNNLTQKAGKILVHDFYKRGEDV